MKGFLGKYEPVFHEEIDKEGNKAKIRKIKLSIYVDPVDFPDVTAYDGATLDIYRPDEYSEPGLIAQTKRQAIQMAKILLEEALVRLTKIDEEETHDE